MKRSTELLAGAAVTLFFVGLSGWIFCLSKVNTAFTVMHLAYVRLALAALAAFVINDLLMRRGAPLPLYLTVQLLLVIGAAVLFTHSVTLEPYRARTVILNCIIYCIAFPATGYAAYEAPKQSTLLIFFDVSAGGIAILLLLDRYLTLPAARETLLLCAAVLLVTLLALISQRAGRFHGNRENVRGSGIGGKLLLAVLFAAVIGLTAAVAAVASVGIRRVAGWIAAALDWLWNGIVFVLRLLYRGLEALMNWLSQFAKPMPAEAIPGSEMGGSADATMEQIEVAFPPWVLWTLIALGAVIFVWLLFQLRRQRFHRSVRAVKKPMAARRENGAGDAVRALLRRILTALRFRADCIFRRNTPAGLLLRCQRKAKKICPRRTGESGEEFLLRLADRTGAAPLRELASLVERTFYAPGLVTVPRELQRSIRSIKFT